MSREKVYLSGPISSVGTDEARKAFGEAEARMKDMGYRTCNPLKMHLCVWLASHFGKHGYMACVFLQLCWIILTADGMLMLHGWHKSDGARLERALARCLQMPVMFQDRLGKQRKRKRNGN